MGGQTKAKKRDSRRTLFVVTLVRAAYDVPPLAFSRGSFLNLVLLMSSLYNEPFIYEALTIPLSCARRETAKLRTQSIQQGVLPSLSLKLLVTPLTCVLL